MVVSESVEPGFSSSLARTEDTPGHPDMGTGQAPEEKESPSDANIQNFILSNAGSIIFGFVAEYAIKRKDRKVKRILDAMTVGLSALSVYFSFRLALEKEPPERSHIWKLLGGFLTYVNMIVMLRAGIDFFSETPKLPTLPKFAREILKV